MTNKLGRNINTNDAAVLSSIALNDTTSTKIADAKISPPRLVFTVTNNSVKDIWLKLQAAATDNDKKGIFMPKGSYWEMPTDNIYSGEISAIADSGTPTVHVTEY